MGLLVDGKWQDKWYETKKHGGKFVRPQTQFRNRVEIDSKHPPEAGRYHLYVSYACPWAHRTLMVRRMKGLEDVISVSVVNSHMDGEGWRFDDAQDGATVDHINGFSRLHQVYTAAKTDYTGRVTVPILWDKQEATIVNNESAEIVRMLNADFNSLAAYPELDLYPEPLRTEIDALNERIYHDVNNGVYKTGFATSQAAYEEAFHTLFAALDWLDGLLATRRYLTGPSLTEADWRLFATLIRFDPVYVGHFKCNQKRIADYEHLSGFVRELYQVPGIADTVRLDHIKQHYYGSHPTINPTGVVPLGPALDWDSPHGRDAL